MQDGGRAKNAFNEFASVPHENQLLPFRLGQAIGDLVGEVAGAINAWIFAR